MRVEGIAAGSGGCIDGVGLAAACVPTRPAGRHGFPQLSKLLFKIASPAPRSASVLPPLHRRIPAAELLASQPLLGTAGRGAGAVKASKSKRMLGQARA